MRNPANIASAVEKFSAAKIFTIPKTIQMVRSLYATTVTS